MCPTFSVLKKLSVTALSKQFLFGSYFFNKFIGFENVFKFITSKLDTSIGMKNQYLRNRSVPDGHPPCRNGCKSSL